MISSSALNSNDLFETMYERIIDPVKLSVVPEMLREAVQVALANETGDWQDLPRRFKWVIGP